MSTGFVAVGWVGCQVVKQRGATTLHYGRRLGVDIQGLEVEGAPADVGNEIIVIPVDPVFPLSGVASNSGAVRGGGESVNIAGVTVYIICATAAHSSPAGVEAPAAGVDLKTVPARTGIEMAVPIVHVPAVMQSTSGRVTALCRIARVVVSFGLMPVTGPAIDPAVPAGEHADRTGDTNNPNIIVIVSVLGPTRPRAKIGTVPVAIIFGIRSCLSPVPARVDPDLLGPVEDVTALGLTGVNAVTRGKNGLGISHGARADEIPIVSTSVHKSHHQFAVHPPGKSPGVGDLVHVVKRHRQLLDASPSVGSAVAATLLEAAKKHCLVYWKHDRLPSYRVIECP